MITQIYTTPNMRKIAQNVIPLPYIPLLLLLVISILSTTAAAQDVDIVPRKEIEKYDSVSLELYVLIMNRRYNESREAYPQITEEQIEVRETCSIRVLDAIGTCCNPQL